MLRPRALPLRVTTRGAAVLVLGTAHLVVGAVTSVGALTAIGAAAVSAVALALVVVVALRPRVGVRRLLARSRVTAGDAVALALVVRNSRRLPTLAARWRDRYSDRWSPDPEGELPALRPGQGVRRHYQLFTEERGVYWLGPLRVESTDPLGLVALAITVDTRSELVVTPRLTPLNDVPFDSDVDQGVSVQRVYRASETLRDLNAREYRAGDPLRHMHWRATAHHGELMVRQEDFQERARALLVLDSDLDSYLGPEERSALAGRRGGRAEQARLVALSRFEWAVEALASLAANLDERGVRVTLVAGGPPPYDDETLEEMLVRLARVDLETGHPDPFATAAAFLADTRQPVFAVIGGAQRDLVPLEGIARRTSAATALLLPGAEALGERLLEQGWRRLPVNGDTEVGEAWAHADPTPAGAHHG